MVDKKTTPQTETNTFGDDLEDNLSKKFSRGSVSHCSTETHEITTYGDNPAERLEGIENKYRLVPPNHTVTIECSFRYKNPTPSDFFEKSRFVIWRDRSIMPNTYWWERKDHDATASPYKYGPFKEISGAFDDIKDIFGVSVANIERIA